MIDINMTLNGPLSDTLIAAAAKRGREPAEVFADIVEVVLGDDLVDAVLDDRA